MNHLYKHQQAEMEGPADTPYVGKFFLLRFTFGPDFPTTPPTAHFLTKVYHPNVDSTTGAICVNTLKRDWKPEHTMKHCLAVIRCLLIEPFPESSLNEDAGKLFMESYEEYCKRARLHADVHGRTQSMEAAAKARTEMEEMRVLQNASHNSCSTPASVRNNNADNNSTKKMSKTKMTKKKSLKRL
jgi:ubiquitin-conjugating enzyme E2 S